MPLYEKLDGYQRNAVRKALKLKSLCIFFEQGAGKSHPTISIIEEVSTDDSTFVGFLCVPLTNIETTWERLIKEHLTIQYTRNWEKFKSMSPPKLFLTHYEALPEIDKKFTKVKWTFGCFDESQRLKARGTRTSRIAGRIKECEYRIALSGTPADGDPIDLFAQLRFVAPQLFGNDRSAWRRFDEHFLKPTGYMGYQRKFRTEILDEFYEIIEPYILRVETRNVVDLPESRFHIRPLQMLGSQKRIYQTMERDMVVKLIEEANAKRREAGRTIRASAGLRITQMIKLQQICGGFLHDDEGEIHKLQNTKLRDLHYVLTRKAKFPMVIFHRYTPEGQAVEKLVHELGYKYGMINGKVKDKKRIKARTNIQNDFQSGKLDVIICQIKSGGVGLDLFKGVSAYFYSTSFSWIDFDQCQKRINRRGQVNETDIYFSYVENSIDEDIYSAIISKKSVNKKMFNHMKKRSLRHG